MKLNEVTEAKAGDLDIVKNYRSGDLFINEYYLTSMEGCPKVITGAFECDIGNLTSFEHFPKYIKQHCSISDNKFTSFKDIDQHIEFIGDRLLAQGMDITSGYSDLFGIDGLQTLYISGHFEIEDIVNRYLPKKDLIEFQDEMIKAGYESYL